MVINKFAMSHFFPDSLRMLQLYIDITLCDELQPTDIKMLEFELINSNLLQVEGVFI